MRCPADSDRQPQGGRPARNGQPDPIRTCGLTRPSGHQPSGAALYPDGVRSYLRVITHDLAQGIAAAHLAKREGARRAAVLYQKELDEPYARGLTVPFVAAARGLGLDVVRFEWPLRKSYATLAASVAEAHPDAVFLAGLPQGNAKRLLAGPPRRARAGVTLIAPDSFAGRPPQELGPSGEGLWVTSPGFPRKSFRPPASGSCATCAPASTNPLYAPEAAQATEVLLDAIARSDGTRASVVEELFATKVENGILGSFSFDRYGDIVPAPVGIYRIRGRQARRRRRHPRAARPGARLGRSGLAAGHTPASQVLNVVVAQVLSRPVTKRVSPLVLLVGGELDEKGLRSHEGIHPNRIRSDKAPSGRRFPRISGREIGELPEAGAEASGVQFVPMDWKTDRRNSVRSRSVHFRK